MKRYIFPTRELNPNQIVILVATNNLKRGKPVKLASKIAPEVGDTKAKDNFVVVSVLVARNDEYAEKVKEIICHLKQKFYAGVFVSYNIVK